MCQLWEKEKSVQGLGGKQLSKESSGRPRCRWKYDIYIYCEGGEWINFAQDGDRWPAVVNTKQAFRFLKMLGIYTLSQEMLTSQNTLCSTELVS